MLDFSSIGSIQNALKKKETTCVDVLQHYLNQIEKNKSLNAFLEVFETSAKEQAALVDKKLSENKAGRLAGVVIGIKDNICYKGHKVSASSKILEGFTSLYSSTVVERLLAEDAIIIGRLNSDEFAMGSSNENSAYGKVLNPLDTTRVPGGSSGGSAVAVKAGMCTISLGSDTGGSIRQPASFCGLVGFKPTYGRVSRHGLIAYASSFDQIGPLSHHVEDAALIMEIIAGADEFDSTASQKPVEKYSQQLSSEKKYSIAIPKECVESSGLDEEIKNRINKFAEELKSQGHSVEYFSFPQLPYLVPTYYVLTTAEASSNLSRFDGVHYGYRSKEATDLESTYKKTRSTGFGKEVQRRIMTGTFVLSAGYYDAYYAKAQKSRRKLRDFTLDVLKKHDFILTPSTPGTAFKFGENAEDPVKMYLEDIYTVLANLTGLPAVSLPLGTHSNGLPFGLQLMSAPFTEGALFSFSNRVMNKR